MSQPELKFDERLTLEEAWDAAWDEWAARVLEQYADADYLEIEDVGHSYAERLSIAVKCRLDYFPDWGEDPFGDADICCVARGDLWGCGHDLNPLDWDVIRNHAKLIHEPYHQLEQIFEFMKGFDIPARDPDSLLLHIRLLHAGVRII
jgi:hypothetical protein